MTMAMELGTRVEIPQATLLREVEGETVLLNLDSGHYYSLDEIGTAVWRAVTTAGSVGAAVSALLDEYDVDRATLEQDVTALLAELRDEGLVRLIAP